MPECSTPLEAAAKAYVCARLGQGGALEGILCSDAPADLSEIRFLELGRGRITVAGAEIPITRSGFARCVVYVTPVGPWSRKLKSGQMVKAGGTAALGPFVARAD